jgi:hypothetical protein
MASLQEALVNLLKKKEPKKETTIEEEREGAKNLSKAIPEGMFPHDALKKKKSRMQQLDEETQE